MTEINKNKANTDIDEGVKPTEVSDTSDTMENVVDNDKDSTDTGSTDTAYTDTAYTGTDENAGLYRFPNIAKRISTRLGLWSAFLVLIPLLLASTIAFLNQGASQPTQEAVAKQLSQQATRVADSVQWQLATKLNTPLNTDTRSLSSGTTTPLLPKVNRELEYQLYDRLYEIAAPLDDSINTSTDAKLGDVVREIAAPIEAEGSSLYLYDGDLRQVYASPSIDGVNTDVATTVLQDFAGEGLIEVNSQTYFASRQMLPAVNWQMVLYQPAPTATARNMALMRPLALLTFLGPLLALLLGNLWGFFNLQRPLNDLREGVQRLLNGKQTAAVSIRRTDELGLLTKEVSLLSQKFSSVVLEESEPKERLFEAQERIRQQYLRENYPEEFAGEEAVRDIQGKDTKGISENTRDKKDSVAKVELDKLNKEVAKKAEVDKKAIADLEKALEEARATQITLTESNTTLESQLKALKDKNSDLVSKADYEAELSQLQLQLDDKSKTLKKHIRAAKASSLGFNVAESEVNMTAAEQDVDELGNLLSSFGEQSLGIKAKSIKAKSIKAQGIKANSVETKTSGVEKIGNLKKDSSKRLTTKQGSSDSTIQTGSYSAKDFADAAKPLQNVAAVASTEKQDTKLKVKVDEKPEIDKKVKKKPASSKSDSDKQQEMLTPLPSVDTKQGDTSKAYNIDISTESSQKNETVVVGEKKQQSTGITVHESSAQTKISAKTLNLKQESQQVVSPNVAAIDYDKALTLELDKAIGFKEALEGYLRDFKQYTQIQVEDYISKLTLSSEQEALLRDFIKAAFDNIAKHSDASSVLLELNTAKDESAVNLMIVDNGKGFDTQALADKSKLKQFEKAFSILNGELMLYSSSKEGTMINASLPL